MTEWNPKIEMLIRELGDYTERQMKDLLKSDAPVTGTALRCVFRGVSTGIPLKRRLQKEGLVFNNWLDGLQSLVELSEKNGSNAAEKIKKALPVAEKLNDEFKTVPGGVLKKIKYAKCKGLSY
jgi:hypothetical protein